MKARSCAHCDDVGKLDCIARSIEQFDTANARSFRQQQGHQGPLAARSVCYHAKRRRFQRQQRIFEAKANPTSFVRAHRYLTRVARKVLWHCVLKRAYQPPSFFGKEVT
ncbi:hypothetical protein [Bradyrhizobium sp. Leo121]|uniref:hypothetical protein n=1 Tax=Bradyrhizobium sp. Leo121 TaxID=1571195 RepID=UPI001029700C|nr:hypothetical protein [Bradyrhizobium sp. Leo121]